VNRISMHLPVTMLITIIDLICSSDIVFSFHVLLFSRHLSFKGLGRFLFLFYGEPSAFICTIKLEVGGIVPMSLSNAFLQHGIVSDMPFSSYVLTYYLIKHSMYLQF